MTTKNVVFRMARDTDCARRDPLQVAAISFRWLSARRADARARSGCPTGGLGGSRTALATHPSRGYAPHPARGELDRCSSPVDA